MEKKEKGKKRNKRGIPVAFEYAYLPS